MLSTKAHIEVGGKSFNILPISVVQPVALEINFIRASGIKK